MCRARSDAKESTAGTHRAFGKWPAVPRFSRAGYAESRRCPPPIHGQKLPSSPPKRERDCKQRSGPRWQKATQVQDFVREQTSHTKEPIKEPRIDARHNAAQIINLPRAIRSRKAHRCQHSETARANIRILAAHLLFAEAEAGNHPQLRGD